MTLQEFTNWARAQGGNIAKTDGGYPGQCVSLINQYCHKVLGVPAGAWGDAKDWGANNITRQYFDVLEHPSNGDLQAGDIVVYPNLGGGYGHIVIYIGGDQYLDQNGRGGVYRVGVGGDYGGIRRRLRRKGGNPQPAPAPQPTPPQNSGIHWKKGRATVIVDKLNVRNEPSTNSAIAATYSRGQSFNYDGWMIANGYVWLTYVSYSGTRRYVAEGPLDGNPNNVWVSGGVS